VVTANGSPGLSFRYALRHYNGERNFDIIPASFAVRWSGTSGTGVASNARIYTNYQELRLINRVLVRFTMRTSNPDRQTGQYSYITLESDVDLRTQP
jgi:hypothetical protein